MTLRPSARLFGPEPRWPPALRAVAGGAAGWAAVRWGVTESVPAWSPAGAACVGAMGALAAPAVTGIATEAVVAGWAAASAIGLYLGVPETDHVVGVGAVLFALLLASLTVRRSPSWLLVAGFDVVLPWAAVRGAPAGGPALVAGLATPGLLVLAWLVALVPGPRRALVVRGIQPFVLVGLQLVFAVFVARRAASSETTAMSAAIAVAASVVLVAAARLTVGATSW